MAAGRSNGGLDREDLGDIANEIATILCDSTGNFLNVRDIVSLELTDESHKTVAVLFPLLISLPWIGGMRTQLNQDGIICSSVNQESARLM